MHKYLKGRYFIMILLSVMTIYFSAFAINESQSPSEQWTITESGLLSYPKNRGPVDYKEQLLNDTGNESFKKIIYKSKNEDIYALLRTPKSKERQPAIIFLPGATVTKEGTDNTAKKFASLGYITFTIDERGNGGETKDGIRSMEDEFQRFMSTDEPIHHKMVFDVLKAYDFLKQQPEVDKNNIYVYGESMGGRFAIIAGAIEPGIKGVIAVSTAGYNSAQQQFQNQDVARFFRSIDPDSYIGKIAPRKTMMIHSKEDTVIAIDMAKTTFKSANNPKKFMSVTCKTHGWCDEMMDPLTSELGD